MIYKNIEIEAHSLNYIYFKSFLIRIYRIKFFLPKQVPFHFRPIHKFHNSFARISPSRNKCRKTTDLARKRKKKKKGTNRRKKSFEIEKNERIQSLITNESVAPCCDSKQLNKSAAPVCIISQVQGSVMGQSASCIHPRSSTKSKSQQTPKSHRGQRRAVW